MKPPAYGRGVGYPLWDEDKCNKIYPQGCEKYGAIWYPKCKDDFHNVACCVCSPDCQSGMKDVGVSCQKDSYGRGAGETLVCKDTEEEEAALCYNPCKNGFGGSGPVCWENCPDGMTECGALCLASGNSCSSDVKKIVEDILLLAA